MKTLLAVAMLLIPSVVIANPHDDRAEEIAREQIDLAIRRQNMRNETDSAIKESREDYDKRRNWTPDNDTTKKENQYRYWDSAYGEFRTKEDK